MHFTIGIDPDTKATGIGVLMNGEPEFGAIATAQGRRAEDRVEEMAESLRAALDEVYTYIEAKAIQAIPEVTIAIEWQALRAEDLQRGVGASNRIMNLMAVAGMAYQAASDAFPIAKIKHVYPCAWKGTIPKHIHQERLRRKLAGGLLTNMEKQLGKTKFSHVLDGLGLALALYERKV